MYNHLADRLHEPSPGEYIALVGADGTPNNKISKVKTFVSADYDDATFEVVDSFNAVRYITAAHPESDCDWLEIIL